MIAHWGASQTGALPQAAIARRFTTLCFLFVIPAVIRVCTCDQGSSIHAVITVLIAAIPRILRGLGLTCSVDGVRPAILASARDAEPERTPAIVLADIAHVEQAVLDLPVDARALQKSGSIELDRGRACDRVNNLPRAVGFHLAAAPDPANRRQGGHFRSRPPRALWGLRSGAFRCGRDLFQWSGCA